MKEQKSDEIDLTNLFSVFKEKIKASIVLLFDLIDYLFKEMDSYNSTYCIGF